MIIAGGLGLASMVVSAILCCRRGKLPSLAFGILLAACFTSLAVIASLQFYGPNLDLVRKADRVKFAAEVQNQRLRTSAESEVERAGLAWARSDHKAPVPIALRTASGIIAPVLTEYGQVQYRMQTINWWHKDGLRHLFGIGGNRYFNRASAVLLTSATSRISDARARWISFKATPWAFIDPEYETEKLDAAAAALSNANGWDSDNLFAGIGCGAAMSTVWMLFAMLLNWFANADWSVGTRRHAAHLRTRGIA